ncbi:MAG: hypothetical protein KDK70_18570 [Myxococcales bacterium]|nr:hypothetical protein [Myxococcales bacterium]
MQDGPRRRRRRRTHPVGRLAAAALGLVGVGAVPSARAAPSVALEVASARALPLSPALARGRVEQRTLALHGIPVRGAYRTVRIRPDGTTETLAAREPASAPQRLPSQARIAPAAVPGLVAAARGMADEPALERPPELVYLMVLGHPVLAWETQLALTLRPEPSRPTVWVSAASGRVLLEVEQVWSSRARVFAQNPAVTPEPVEVELVDIHVEDAGHPLVGTRVQAFNCVGEEPAEVSPWWEEDECWPLQTVHSDAAGDFIVPTPDVVRVEDNIDPSDPYAELSMYVHAERFLDVMQAKGIEQYECEFSSMLANFRTLQPTATLDFSPLNNAYYTNQCDPELGPTMIFGQGSEVDFGYDADVIYHELGHGMVALLAPEGLFGRRLRPDAALVDAGGINEALADYFSVMLTDDARLADYVGRFWSANARPFIRDAENVKVCPTHTAGQVHNDGEPFMAALWATRKRLGPEGKEALDQAVIEALLRMPSDADLETAAALMEQTVAAQIEAGALTVEDGELLHRSLESRGLLSCPRVITDPADVAAGRFVYLRRADDGVYPFFPGPMQLRYEVPPDADDMVVTFTLTPRQSDDPVEAAVLVKRGDAPIAFEYQLVAVDDPPPEGTSDDPLREVTLVTGDWDLELRPAEVTKDDYVVELGGLEPGEVLHVMLVNVTPTEAGATEAIVRSSTAWVDDAAGSTGGSAAETGALPEVELVRAGAATGGCDCRSGAPDGSSGAGWGALAGLLLAAHRRRRGQRRGQRRRRWPGRR